MSKGKWYLFQCTYSEIPDLQVGLEGVLWGYIVSSKYQNVIEDNAPTFADVFLVKWKQNNLKNKFSLGLHS